MVDWPVKTAGKFLDESGKLDVKLGLVELLINAIKHGNLGGSKDPSFLIQSRKVSVEFKTSDSHCEWTITDEGEGFDWQSYLKRLATDPLGQEGKGLLCCKYHFSELEFNSAGNSVTGRKIKAK